MKLRVLTGPPCSGKSTHVAQHSEPGDVVVDFDRIAAALGGVGDQVDWSTTSPHRHLARVARAAVVKALIADQRRMPGVTVWLIETNLEPWQRALYTRAGGEFVELDPGAGECHRRADDADRPPATHEQIDTWYAGHAGPAAAAGFFA